MAPIQHSSQGGPGRIFVALVGTAVLAVLLGIAFVVVQPFGSTTAATQVRSGGAAQAASAAAVPGAAGTADAGGVRPRETAPSATQTNEGGQVTVKVTWQGRAAGGVFKVVLDTHSINLDSVDLKQSAIVRANGAREALPLTWDAPQGGHHREGKLVFPDTAADGKLLLGSETRTLELVIRDVAGVQERVFKWQV